LDFEFFCGKRARKSGKGKGRNNDNRKYRGPSLRSG
jgi:hypothetical protein